MLGGDLSLVSPDSLLYSFVFLTVVVYAAWTASREQSSSDTRLPYTPPALGDQHWHKPFLEEVKEMAVLDSLRDGAGKKLSGVRCQTHDVCALSIGNTES